MVEQVFTWFGTNYVSWEPLIYELVVVDILRFTNRTPKRTRNFRMYNHEMVEMSSPEHLGSRDPLLSWTVPYVWVPYKRIPIPRYFDRRPLKEKKNNIQYVN